MSETFSVPDVPAEATDIISFDGQEHGPAVIRYNVPLPGRHTGQRVIRLDLGLTSDDFKNEAVSGVTESVKALDWEKPAGSPNWTYNADKALNKIEEVYRYPSKDLPLIAEVTSRTLSTLRG